MEVGRVGPFVARRCHARRPVPARFVLDSLRNARVIVTCLALLAGGAQAAEWSCYGTKPGHPTAEERAAFVREASELALKAEKAHGVPASALAAMAIAESGYGWTRIALEANNLFAWKFGSTARKDGRRAYVPSCAGRRGSASRYVTFANRAEAFDHVAAQLATIGAYRKHTEAYKAARRRGDPPEKAVEEWLRGIARRYSGDPAAFTAKLLRIMNNPVDPEKGLAPEKTLHRLSQVSWRPQP